MSKRASFPKTAQDELESLRRLVRESGSRLRLALEATGLGVWEWNLQTGRVTLNQRAAALLGYTPAEMGDGPSSWEQLVHPEDWPRAKELLQEHLEGRQPLFEAEYRLRHKSGAWIRVKAKGQVVDWDDAGRPLVLCGLHQNLAPEIPPEDVSREQWSLLENLIDQSPSPVWISDAEGTLIRVNQACCDMLNIRREEIVGKYNVLNDNIVAEQGCLPLVQSVFNEGKTVHFFLEYDVTRLEQLTLKDGAKVIIGVTMFPVIDRKGGITNAVIMHHDMTPRLKAEKDLRESEGKYRGLSQEFRAILDGIPGSLVLISPEMKIVWTNEYAATSLGMTPGEFLGSYCYQARHNRHEPCESCAVRRCFFTGNPERGENETLDGRIWELFASPILGDQGEVKGVIELGFEVTEKRRADRELQASESMLRGVFRATPVGITFSRNRVLLNANDSMCQLIGYEPHELIGKSARMFYLTDEEFEEVGRKLYAPATQKGHSTVETLFRRKDGNIINVVLHGAMLHPDDPEAGYVVTVHDITGRKQAEEEKRSLEAQLFQAQKMEAIGQLAGGVAHDFNNLLTAIFGHVELAMGDLEAFLPGAQTILDSLREVQRGAERASNLTRQLLAFSRRQIIRPEVRDLNAILRDLEKMLNRLISENIDLTLSLAPWLPMVEVDPGKLEQVIVNLVVNARDSMPNGGKLLLETKTVTLDESYLESHADIHAGEYAVLSVADTGCGMDRVTLDRVFEPFFTTKPHGHGTGLGLSTAYGIVKQAGGHITAYSEPGHGTTFKVYLPGVKKPVSTAPDQHAEASPPGGTETIVLCEDDSAVRELAMHLLSDAGYAVLPARDAGSALQAAANHRGPVHLLLTDVIIPDMDGRRLSDELKARHPEVKTLFMSGYTSNVIAHHGVLEKNVEFLEKPFNKREFLKRVREVLDKPE